MFAHNCRITLEMIDLLGMRMGTGSSSAVLGDFFEISERYGDRIVLTGGMDVTILATNVRAEMEREVRTKLVQARGKKYIFHPRHDPGLVQVPDEPR